MVSYLDLILLIPIGYAIWKGWRNGFVMEVFSMLALFVGIYAGIHLSDWAAGFLRNKLDVKAEYLPVISFAVVFILVLVAMFFLGRLITKNVNAGGVETWNKIGGAFFSLTKFLLFMSMLFIFFNMLDSRVGILPKEQKAKSYFYEPIYKFSLFLLPAMEKSDFYKKLRHEKMAPVFVDQKEVAKK